MPEALSTTIGEIPLEEVVLESGGRAWHVLHSGAILSLEDEQRFLAGDKRLPYGLVLWPAAIALAHAIATRPMQGLRVLELGAGTGLPGLVAAARGARVVQTDNQRVALFVCAKNAARNGVEGLEHRLPDWTAWDDAERYDVILGSDILYGTTMHPHLRAIFEANLAPGGTVLLADPFRKSSFPLVEAMAAEGWDVRFDKWTVGIVPPERAVGVFALTRS